jgi:translation initiation factor 2B subunit (eIF-2B alpha/beta/delta family)
VPDAEAEIEKLFTNPAASGVFSAGPSGSTVNKGDPDMTDLEKKVGDLTSQVADLTKRAEKAEADLAKATTDLAAERPRSPT